MIHVTEGALARQQIADYFAAHGEVVTLSSPRPSRDPAPIVRLLLIPQPRRPSQFPTRLAGPAVTPLSPSMPELLP